MRRARARLVLVFLSLAIFDGSIVLGVLQTPPFHVYWTQPDQTRMTRDVASLRQVFPTLEQLRVDAFRNQDWCRNIAYAGGRFSNTRESTCNLFDGAPSDFTRQANSDFSQVAGALNSTGVWVYTAEVEYDSSGRATSAEFDLIAAPWRFDRWSYVYDPGGSLPPDMENEETYTRIDSDWYFRWEDWM